MFMGCGGNAPPLPLFDCCMKLVASFGTGPGLDDDDCPPAPRP